MTHQLIAKSVAAPARGPVIVTGNGPFDGLGIVFGGAVRGKKKAPRSRKNRRTARRLALMTLVTGALSVLLYALLYTYQGDIVRLADLARHGEHIDFIVPIAIALVFSLVHGAFTEGFWSLLGLKPKNH